MSAPTGSGKTWIAVKAIHSFLERGLRVWYASPLKALSNSIYQEFCREFGSSLCGILTGDRKENPDAPIIVGTTEILRNQLYDAMHGGFDIGADLVVLDEAHYLSDPDRGVVWEEVLIYLPPRVRLLLLSATISNPREVCDWLKAVRGVPMRIVRSEERPVPLEMLFLYPEGLVGPLGGRKGLAPGVKRFLGSERQESRRRGRERIRFGELINLLRQFDLLPAIFFLKSRAECDQALRTCSTVEKPGDFGVRFGSELRAFLRDYPHLAGHRQLWYLSESLVGSHHGGQLPYWKVLVERMMNRGYLEAIFSTSTVAAGVNFPARTVVLVQSDRYNGREFIDLSATDLHQMIGRAGRRGKDHIGFALIVPGIHQDPQLILQLKDSPPEPLQSQIRINFSMTLNLLLSHTPSEVKELLGRSFALYQERRANTELRSEWDRLMPELKRLLPHGKCDTDDPFEMMENIRKRARLQRDAKGLRNKLRRRELLGLYKNYLQPGRLFLHRNGKVYVVFRAYEEEGRQGWAAYPVKKGPPKRKRRVGLRKVGPGEIKAVFDYRMDLTEDHQTSGLEQAFESIPFQDLRPIEIQFTEVIDSREMERSQETLPCQRCAHLEICHGGKKGELGRVLARFQNLAPGIRFKEGGLWLSFKRHVRFLKETGFLDGEDRLTSDGLWASKLRLDQPLLIAEAIRSGALEDLPPVFLAGALAPFVWDRVSEPESKLRPGLDVAGLQEALDKVLSAIEGIRALKRRRGFDTPPLLFWPGVALYLWASGASWEQVLAVVSVDEGDLASLIMRSADHLRQVTNLTETHPDLARTAAQAIDLILREPVYLA